MKRFYLWLLAVLFSSIALAYEAPFDPYPRSFIDRPFTLPASKRAIELWWFDQLPTYSGTTQASIGIPLPAFDLPVSDDVTFVFFPFSFGVRHQISRDKEQEIGVSLIVGYSYDSTSGLKMRPSLMGFRRQYFTSSLAFDANIVINPVVPMRSGNNMLWSSAATMGPLWQVHPHIALRPTISLSLSQAPFLPPGTVVELPEAIERPDQSPHFSLPVGLEAQFSVTSDFDFSFIYNYDSIGQTNGYQNHSLFLKGVYLW